VWWFCYSFQYFIKKEAEKNGVNTQKAIITRVSVPADIDAAVNHALWARGVAEGQILPSHITVYEHRDRIMPYTPIPRLITGFIFILVGDLDKSYNYAVIIGPMIATLIIFILLYRITGSLFFAFSFSLGIIIMARLPDQIVKDISNVLLSKNFEFSHVKGYLFNKERMDELFISRLEAPALTYFFYALSFYFILTRYMMKKERYWIIIGIFSGMLSLINLFHFLYTSIFCSLLLLAHNLLENNKINLKSFFHFGLGYLIAILPFLLILFYGITTPWYHDIESRVHLEIGRQWRSSLNSQYIWSLIMCVFSLIMYWRLHIKNREIFLWSACLFLVRPIFFNLQIIFGSIPEPDHIERYGTNFGEWLGYVFILYGIISWLKNNEYPFKKYIQPLWGFLYIVLLIVVFSSILWIYNAPSKRAKKVWVNFVRPEGEVELMRYINDKTPKHAVFLTTDFETGLRIVAVTGRHLFISPSNTALTNKELEERLVIGFKILDLTEKNLQDYILEDSKHYAIIFANLYFPRYLDSSFKAKAEERIIPEKKIKELSHIYEKLEFDIKKRREFLQGLKLDYILVSPKESDLINIEKLKERFGEPVYDKEGYLVFKYL
jgi:hypothetical protein